MDVFRAGTAISLLSIIIFLIAVLFSIAWNIDTKEVVLSSHELFFAIKLSLLTATISTLLALILGVPSAYMLSRSNFTGKSFVDTLLDLPVVLSPVALGTALLAFFSTPLGKLLDFGFVFGIPGIILAQFIIIVALMIRLMKTGFDSINKRYEDVAYTLGLTKFETFYRVTLPLSKHALASAVILCWARAIGEFGATITLAGAIRFRTETLPVAIFLNLESANLSNALTIVYMLVVISIIILILVRRFQHNQS